MTEKPLVSVLMTAYNREDYVAEAIESVLSSTYENFELIIVDDCSKDNTVAIARQYAAKDARISVYLNEKNLGDYVNRNKAASYASGKYIKYWDSDDVMYPHCLEVMVRCIEQFPAAGFGLCKPHTKVYDRPLPYMIDRPFEQFVKDQGIFSNAPGSAIINRELFNRLGGFSGKRYVGDVEFWLKISQETSLVIMPAAIGWNREHAQTERSSEVQKYLQMEKLRIDILLDAFKYSKLANAQDLKNSIVAQRKATNMKVLVKHLLSFQFSDARKRFILSRYLIKQAAKN